MSLLPTRMKQIKTYIKVREWKEHFTHCKSMVIIHDAQEQLTLQVRAGQNSEQSKLLRLYSLHAR